MGWKAGADFSRWAANVMFGEKAADGRCVSEMVGDSVSRITGGRVHAGVAKLVFHILFVALGVEMVMGVFPPGRSLSIAIGSWMSAASNGYVSTFTGVATLHLVIISLWFVLFFTSVGNDGSR